MGHPEKDQNAEDPMFQKVRLALAERFKRQYEIFKRNKHNVIPLITVYFTGETPLDIKAGRVGAVPYRNLGRLFEAKFEADRHSHKTQIPTLEEITFIPFEGLASSYNILNGNKMLLKTTFYQLQSKPSEKRIVVSKRFFKADDKDLKDPLFERWTAEKRPDGYLFGRESVQKTELITAGTTSQ